MYLGQMTCAVGLAGRYMLRGVHSIEIKKSVHQIIQTAKVELPLSVLIRNNTLLERIKLADKIKEGDAISLAFGYDGNNKTEFTGYIKRINPKQPLELECEDEMYLLRKLNLKKSFKKNDVKDVLQFLVDEVYKAFGVRFKLYDNIPKVTVTNFLIKGANGIAVLQELSDKYLLSSYLTTINNEKVLYCGLAYGLIKGKVNHVLNRNTISIEELKYQTDVDRTYKVEVINHMPNGFVKKFIFGDPHGQQLKVYIAGNKTDEELKHLAEAQIELNKAAGYKGKFKTFIIPYVEPGYIDGISDLQFKDRGGNYYIGTVTTFFDTGGGRREPEIDIRVL